MIRRGALLVALASLAACAGVPRDAPMGCDLAALYVAAGNSGDAAAIAPFLADDVAAIFLHDEAAADAAGSAIHGKPAVLEAVGTYTAQCPSCRSSLRCLAETPSAAYGVEDVVFTDQDGVQRRQSAPLVIELRDGRIQSIVYFPAVKDAR